jgi:hypothetical protein
MWTTGLGQGEGQVGVGSQAAGVGQGRVALPVRGGTSARMPQRSPMARNARCSAELAATPPESTAMR